jgi:hypothetical protein
MTEHAPVETREGDGNSRATSFDGHWKSLETTNVAFLTSKGACMASSNHVTNSGPWYSSCLYLITIETRKLKIPI